MFYIYFTIKCFTINLQTRLYQREKCKMPEDIKTYSYLSLSKEIGGHRQVWSRMSKSKMY